MKIDPVRASLFAAVVIMLAGYLFVFRPLEGAVAERYASIDEQRVTIRARLAFARRLTPLRAERDALAAALRRMHLYDTRAAIVDRFLHVAERVAANEHVAIVSIAASTDSRPAAKAPVHASGPQAVATPIAFDRIPLSMSVHGRYGDLLLMVRDFIASDVPAQIGIDSIASDQHAVLAAPVVNALIRVTLLRETDEQPIVRPQSI